MFASGTAYILLHKEEKIPTYLDEVPEVYQLPEVPELPPAAPFMTLYISGGKKDKISKMDIVGFLCQKGNIEKSDLGKIELLDYMSFAAVRYEVAEQVVKAVQAEKMKGKKYKIGIAR